MFTGLIEEIGTIRKLQSKAGSTDLYINCAKVTEDIKLGDSICVNGVCLTATWFSNTEFSATATPETLSVTNLGDLTTGAHVNLERSVTLQTRMGGHMVQGHVDGIGKVSGIKEDGDSQRWEFEVPDSISHLLIYKGSVAINGVSLTVASIDTNKFSVALIPKTIELTTFQHMKTGDRVNIENDLVGKYIFRFMETAQPAGPIV